MSANNLHARPRQLEQSGEEVLDRYLSGVTATAATRIKMSVPTPIHPITMPATAIPRPDSCPPDLSIAAGARERYRVSQHSLPMIRYLMLG